MAKKTVIDLQALDEGQPHWMSQSSPLTALALDKRTTPRVDSSAKERELKEIAKRREQRAQRRTTRGAQ